MRYGKHQSTVLTRLFQTHHSERKQVKPVHNNPAARLHNLVRRLRSTSSNRSAARVWAQALDIPINQRMTGPRLKQLIQEMLAFLDLVDETETGLHELGFDDFYWEALPPLRLVAHRWFSNLHAKQATLTARTTDETPQMF